MSISGSHSRRRRAMRRTVPLALLAALVLPPVGEVPVAEAQPDARRPNVLIVTVDTLRADRLSSYGYARKTSPEMDRLIDGGVSFTQARTVEPLTNPALCSMITSRSPHEHGATRNGLRIQPGLHSLPKLLREHGYRTAAFVGNWTLRDKLSGLGEHFETYEEVLTKARWYGFVRSEATARDLTERTVEWVAAHAGATGAGPFLAWVHYVDPHAPYLLRREHLDVLQTERRRDFSKADRYDTEIAFVDAEIGNLLRRVAEWSPPENTLIVLTSDHGESLGEHNYWGHGRHLYEATLRIPMAFYWKGRLKPARVAAPALNIDIAPTVARLVGAPVPADFAGFDWTGVFNGAPAPGERVTHFEAHRGAVISKHKSDLARRSGLLEVARIAGNRKEILRVKKGQYVVFDLLHDPGEDRPLALADPAPSPGLLAWIEAVYTGLGKDDDVLEALDDESVAALRSLGYVE